MVQTLQILSIALAAIGMGLSLAHALELPGKRRLDEPTYRRVQTIYYPGFTVGGALGEPGAMLATLVLLLLTPSGTAAFWLTLAALACLLVEHGVYWVVTHPVNKAWLAGEGLRGAGGAFFGSGGAMPSNQSWTALRDRWEYSHVARAVFAGLAFLALVWAMASSA